jgi:hypothetical protein
MCFGIIILVVLIFAVVFVIAIIGGTVGAIAGNKQENKELDSMLDEDLEDRLAVVRQQISYSEVVKVTPAEKMNLIGKEAKIVGVIRKRWEESLDSLTLEQLEQTSAALLTTPKLGNREIVKRQKVIAKVIENRRKLPKEIE